MSSLAFYLLVEPYIYYALEQVAEIIHFSISALFWGRRWFQSGCIKLTLWVMGLNFDLWPLCLIELCCRGCDARTMWPGILLPASAATPSVYVTSGLHLSHNALCHQPIWGIHWRCQVIIIMEIYNVLNPSKVTLRAQHTITEKNPIKCMKTKIFAYENIYESMNWKRLK